MISYDIYLFRYYSIEGLLNKLNVIKVEVKKYYVYKENAYYLKIKRKYRKIIKNNFSDYVIEEKLGLANLIEKVVTRPITLISLIISIILFINLSSRVYAIKFNGDYPLIEDSIKEYLREMNVKIFNYNLDIEKTKELEKKLKEKFNDEIEFLEVNSRGANLLINYKKRRKEIEKEDKKGSLYATKDGVIKGFYLESGVKKVKIYDFVKKGDLLVDEILTTSDDKEIRVGTRGKVFASTFYFVEVSISDELDEVSKYSSLLSEARFEVSKNINSEEEYIESERVLVSDLERGYMKIYYVLYEDITI